MKTKLLLLLLLANFSIYAQTNLVSNGDFESWAPNSQPTDWFRFTNGLLYQDSNAQHGASSTKMEITSGTLHFMNSSPFAIQLGKVYRITMYHKLVSGTFSSVELSLTKNDAFKTTLTKTIETSTVNSEWRKIEFDYVATTTQNAEISILVTGTTGSQILIDNVSIVDVAELGPKYTLIPDVNFENALIEAGIDSGTADGKVLTSKIATVTNLFISSKNIASLSGIEDFKALQILSCLYNQLSSVDISNNTNLTRLNIDGNKLTKLDIAKNTKLTELTCDDNQITSLDLSFTPLLTELSFSSNPVTSIDVTNLKLLRRLSFLKCMISSIDLTNNKDLTSLLANRNKLSVLNLSQNKELIHLDFYSNSLTALDVSANTKLEYLNLSSNPITSIDLKLNTNLKALVCVTTQISTLDLSNNKSLIGLNCQNNINLTELNLKNGNNSNLVKSYTYWTGTRGAPEISSFQNNLKLSCIAVDDVAYSNTNWSTLASYPIIFTLDCASLAYTLIPDANFEIKLMALGVDKDGKNGKVLTSSISTLTSLNVSKSNIANLTGIQDFTALTSLNCSENALTTLDVSSNVNLKTLTANKNQLKSINTSKNLALESFTGSENQFTALDFSSNTALLRVYATDNVLTSLNVSNNSKLTTLWCQRNKLPNLEISKNTALTEFVCDRNELEILNVSKNTALTALTCSENKLKSLDVSQNTSLKIFNCSINKLESLNLKNGNNTLLDPANLSLFSNLNLKCILVDDVAYANTNWSKLKDASATYNTDCTVYTLIPDINFETKLISLGIDSGTPDGKVITSKISSVPSLDLYNSNITDLTGIADFQSLTTLSVMSNKLTTVDLTKNVALTNLNVGYNKLTTLNTSKNIALQYLSLSYNEITSLDFAQNVNLILLSCQSNKLTTIDVSNNKKLTTLWCSLNELSNLDVSKNISLTSIQCAENKPLKSIDLRNGKNTLMQVSSSTIDFTKNPLLTCILVDNPVYSNEKWVSFKDVSASYSTVDCAQVTAIPDPAFEDKLIALNIDKDGRNGSVLNTSISSLTSLDVSSSSIKDLTGIKGFTSLTNLNCSGNVLTFLDLSKNTSLTIVNSNNNKLLNLNLKNGNNVNLDLSSNFKNNPDLNCIQVDDEILSTNNWSTLKDAVASYSLDCNVYTLIPDSNFEDKLIALEIDKDGKNGKVLTSSINKVTSLDLESSNITNLKGIEDFQELVSLVCKYNALTSINVKHNKKLRGLDLHDNKLSSLDITENPELFSLSFSKNQISTIDLSQNKKLHYVTADRNLLSSIDFSSNNELENIYCGSNNLTSINVSNLPNLLMLNCIYTSISKLDVTSNTKLEMLYFNDAKLTTIDLTQNPRLKRINLSRNELTTLDISKNPLLELVFIEFNPITTLNLQNGNNQNFILPSSSGTGKNSATLDVCSFLNNKKLSCIQVDNVAFSNANWAKIKDATATYSATCSLGIEDSVFDKVVMYPNPTKGEVNINNISLEKATVYNSLGQLVKSFVFNSGDTNNTINLSDLPKGIYYVYLISEDAASAKKVIVE